MCSLKFKITFLQSMNINLSYQGAWRFKINANAISAQILERNIQEEKMDSDK